MDNEFLTGVVNACMSFVVVALAVIVVLSALALLILIIKDNMKK